MKFFILVSWGVFQFYDVWSCVPINTESFATWRCRKVRIQLLTFDISISQSRHQTTFWTMCLDLIILSAVSCYIFSSTKLDQHYIMLNFKICQVLSSYQSMWGHIALSEAHVDCHLTDWKRSQVTKVTETWALHCVTLCTRRADWERLT